MENKTGKYFKYAIGEIVLVVIGILIALSINNWNEERIKNQQIKGYLIDLVQDLKTDISVFSRLNIVQNQELKNNSKLLIDKSYQTLSVDSISFLSESNFSESKVVTRTYDKIKSTGISGQLGSIVISDAVSEYYSISVPNYVAGLAYDQEMTTVDVLFWAYPENFEVDFNLLTETYSNQEFPFMQSEMDRKKLLIQKIESYQGRNHLRRAIDRKAMLINRVNLIKTNAEKLIEIINQELESF